MGILDWLSKSGISIGEVSVLVLIVLSIIQIAPIKINPWSAIASAIGKALNGNIITKIGEVDNRVKDLDEKVDGVKEDISNLEVKVNNIEAKNDERDAIVARVRILRFCDEMQGDLLHSKDSFDQVLCDITNYNNYCSEHPDFKNKQTEATAEYIQQVYRKRLEKRDFSTFKKLED